MLQASRYLTFGRLDVMTEEGRRLRPVFLSTSARTFLLDSDVALALQEGRLSAIATTAVQELSAAGLVVADNEDELAGVLRASKDAIQANRTRYLVLMPTAWCNMGCEYCGQEHSTDRDTTWPQLVMARAVASLDSPEIDQLSVGWFGGEPMVAYPRIRAFSQALIPAAEARGKEYSAQMTTNGSLLSHDKVRVLHLECRVNAIEITIDGPKSYHDVSRFLKNGGQSFDRIVHTLQQVLADSQLDSLELSVRSNVSRHNSHLAGQFAQEMTDAGFTDTRVLFYPAVVHEWGNDVSDFQMTLMKYAEVELEWLRQLSVHGLSLPLIPTETKPIVCLAVDVRGEVIDPAGNIFSCTEEPLIKGALSRRIGQLSQVAEGDRRPRGAYDDWLDSVSNGETGCRECRILPICGGACPKAWRSGNPPCPALKLNLTDRLDLYAQAYSRA